MGKRLIGVLALGAATLFLGTVPAYAAGGISPGTAETASASTPTYVEWSATPTYVEWSATPTYVEWSATPTYVEWSATPTYVEW